MNELLNSPLMAQLKQGKVPEVPVTVEFSRQALLELAGTLFFLAVAIMLSFQIIKKVS